MQFKAENEHAGRRLDVFLAECLPQFSRARIQDWIKQGRAWVNGAAGKASQPVRAGDTVEVEPAELPPLKAVAEDIPVHVLYADDAVIAIDKPAGMVVHAGAGRHTGTLVNALLHHFRTLSTVGGDERPGIVHRLDRETSGVLVVARTDTAHRALAAQFASRSVEKTYAALVEGAVAKEHGHVRTPIERDPVRRTRMTTRTGKGRAAHTEYRVAERLPGHTLLDVDIHTGRTHQIRVHLASLRHPVAGDTLYGARATPHGRFFLHARRIAFASPATGERVAIESALPAELENWLTSLRAGR